EGPHPSRIDQSVGNEKGARPFGGAPSSLTAVPGQFAVQRFIWPMAWKQCGLSAIVSALQRWYERHIITVGARALYADTHAPMLAYGIVKFVGGLIAQSPSSSSVQ